MYLGKYESIRMHVCEYICVLMCACGLTDMCQCMCLYVFRESMHSICQHCALTPVNSVTAATQEEAKSLICWIWSIEAQTLLQWDWWWRESVWAWTSIQESESSGASSYSGAYILKCPFMEVNRFLKFFHPYGVTFSDTFNKKKFDWYPNYTKQPRVQLESRKLAVSRVNTWRSAGLGFISTNN